MIFRLMTVIFLLNFVVNNSTAAVGSGVRGGGDQFVLDFVRTANLEIYPWMKKNQSRLKGFSADEFIRAVDPEKIQSIDKVFESCDGSDQGREVDACYNQELDKIFLSRSKYPIFNINFPAKRGLIIHEILRRLGLEGNGYQLTSQMVFDDLPSPGIEIPLTAFSTTSCPVITTAVDSVNLSMNKALIQLFINLSCDDQGNVLATLIISGTSKPVESWFQKYTLTGLSGDEYYTPTLEHQQVIADGLRKVSAGLARIKVPLILTRATNGPGQSGVMWNLSEIFPAL